jgi:hypothetical protein
MLDKPDKTARLVATLKEAVPFEVELLASTLARLRERSPEIQIGAKEKVFDVAYEPRHGGIICLIRPTGTDDLVATSLTHLRIRASGLVQSSLRDVSCIREHSSGSSGTSPRGRRPPALW